MKAIRFMSRQRIFSYVRKLGFWGFLFFLAKGLLLYVVLPYLIAKGLIRL